MDKIQVKFDFITEACGEIQQALFKHLVVAIMSDVDSDKVGASTELLLRLAANDFKNRLAQIPEKKIRIKEIVQSLNDVHRHVLSINSLSGGLS
ncbi:MAG: hypothetical protein HXX17_03905 [Geobacteraceae bacterium]|nr:hypothetical protein [Geobacteraceae bacterium]